MQTTEIERDVRHGWDAIPAQSELRDARNRRVVNRYLEQALVGKFVNARRRRRTDLHHNRKRIERSLRTAFRYPIEILLHGVGEVQLCGVADCGFVRSSMARVSNELRIPNARSVFGVRRLRFKHRHEHRNVITAYSTP